MNTTVKLCRDCHQPMEHATSRQLLCNKKLEKNRAQIRSLENENAARQVRNKPIKSIAAICREADALGIRYGRYVARGPDQREEKIFM